VKQAAGKNGSCDEAGGPRARASATLGVKCRGVPTSRVEEIVEEIQHPLAPTCEKNNFSEFLICFEQGILDHPDLFHSEETFVSNR
jgi:hypothetical protein